MVHYQHCCVHYKMHILIHDIKTESLKTETIEVYVWYVAQSMNTKLFFSGWSFDETRNFGSS